MPLWLPQSFWFGGLAFMMLCCVVLMIVSLRHLIAGRWQAMGTLIGVRSVVQDIVEETHV
ncbi:hypothetical protein [Pseudosulfitobacter sp. SM2401]|uniref:hypothetical protein n=1 Tax=Pseudosulfitobacter sp. SM2401 TaxID=3350098 RepID=UPI0036F26A28